MAKTLVIQGANYATNKLDTVVFADVPCTGISFQTSTITIDGSESATINYTVTPSDTTDEIIWASSNENVATVLDGVVTGTGVGTATITATCGRYSATATVTVSVSASIKYYYAGVSGTEGGMATYEANTNYTRLGAFGSGSSATTYELAPTTGTYLENPYAIKIPANITKVKISANSGTSFYDYTASGYVFTKDESISGKIKCISKGLVNFRQMPYTLDVPSGADSFALFFRLANAASASDNPDTLASTLGISIEFLTA